MPVNISYEVNFLLGSPAQLPDNVGLIKMLLMLDVYYLIFIFLLFPIEEFIDLLNSIKTISFQVKWYCAENWVKEKNILLFSHISQLRIIAVFYFFES